MVNPDKWPFDDPKVASVFDNFPKADRKGLLKLRALIFETAAQTRGVGQLNETLKWGQPAYLTPVSKSGSTIRLGLPKPEVSQFTQIARPRSCRSFNICSQTVFPMKAIGPYILTRVMNCHLINWNYLSGAH